MIEFLVQHEGKIYDFSQVVTKIETSHSLNDGCGKLDFSYIVDKVDVACGDVIRLKNESHGLFYGRVFKTSGKKNGAMEITAYDQLRYAKAKDTIAVSGDTSSTLVKRMCNVLQLTSGTIADTGYTLAEDVQDSKTWLDIIYSSISDTLLGINRKYRLADNFGAVELIDMSTLALDVILGDESLCYDYDYSCSIDDEFYNQVKLASDNEATAKRDTYIAKDSVSIKKYGFLQYFEVLDKNANAAQAKAKADALLNLYNAEVQTLSLSCLGDDRIREGCSFYGTIRDIDLNRRLIVKSVKHKYLPIHTMELEVYV